MNEKIKSRKELIPIVEALKREGKSVVFTNGCFDILHVGHVRLLKQAKEHGHVLIVGLNSDESVRALKGADRPFVPEADRAEVLAALSSVDYVTIFGEVDPLSIVTDLKPDVLAKGEDWAEGTIIGQDVVEAHGGTVVRIPFTSGSSTTNLIDKIRSGR